MLVQVATQVFPFLEIPNWVVRLVIVLVAVGFPIALVIAWAFELTPEGLKRTEDVDSFDSRSRHGGQAGQVLPAQARTKSHAWIYIVVVGALLSVGLFMLGRYTSSRGVALPARASLEKSIAVLPFESLSDDKANAYFATGIQDEILAQLSQIADLKVISKTSTQQYKSAPANLREIAQQLGVAHILEGSVQKANDQVRVTVQLINASSDAHLWASTYDRKLTDIFGVESEIAKSIADSLQAKLTGREEQALAVKPTKNPEAYDAYLRGLAAEGQQLHSVYALEEAVRFYEQAVQLDPAFTLAWSRLSRADLDLYSSPNDPTASRREAGSEPWTWRRSFSQTHPKPYWRWPLTRLSCCVTMNWLRPPIGRWAKCCQAALTFRLRSRGLRGGRAIGMKPLLTTSKLSSWIRVAWSCWSQRRQITPIFENSTPR